MKRILSEFHDLTNINEKESVIETKETKYEHSR